MVFVDIPLFQQEAVHSTANDVNLERLRDGKQLVLVRTPKMRLFWNSLIKKLNVPLDQIVRLPGFKTSTERRQYFANNDRYTLCLQALVVWLPNDQVYDGHSEVLLYWLRKQALVLVDCCLQKENGVFITPPFCDHYFLPDELAFEHIDDHVEETVEQDLWSFVRNAGQDDYEVERETLLDTVLGMLHDNRQTLVMNEFGNDESPALQAMTPIVDKASLFRKVLFMPRRGHFLHVHVDSDYGKEAIRAYYQAVMHNNRNYLPLNQDAILSSGVDKNNNYLPPVESESYLRLVYKKSADSLFIVIDKDRTGDQCGTKPVISTQEVMMYLNLFRGENKRPGLFLIVCSVGDCWPEFDVALRYDEALRVHHVHIPDLNFPILRRPIIAETDQFRMHYVHEMKDLLVEEMVHNNNDRLLASYVQFG